MHTCKQIEQIFYSSYQNEQSEIAKQNAKALIFKNESWFLLIVIPGILTFATNT